MTETMSHTDGVELSVLTTGASEQLIMLKCDLTEEKIIILYLKKKKKQ